MPIANYLNRDFQGYGSHPPSNIWPAEARVAVNFVINYEEGGERNILAGDVAAESYLADIPGLSVIENERHLSSESMFEYGARCGVWRLMRLFDQHNINVTVFVVGQALENNPLFCDYLKKANHEIAGHGYRWLDYRYIDKKTEAQHITATIKTVKALTNKNMVGWYTGRRSINTRELVVAAGLQYDSDSYADDLPYWEMVGQKKHLIIPYSLDCNDFRYAVTPGWSSGSDFLDYLIHAFDVLYQEGTQSPKLMTIGLHPRFSGRPGRAWVIKQFLAYLTKKQQVWIATRAEIAALCQEKLA